MVVALGHAPMPEGAPAAALGASEAGAPRARERGEVSRAMAILLAIADGCDSYASLLQHFTFAKPRLSLLLGGLEARGLIVRQTCGVDRRRTNVTLTAEGRQHIERFRAGDRQIDTALRRTRHRDPAGPGRFGGAGSAGGADEHMADLFCDVLRRKLLELPPAERLKAGAAMIIALTSHDPAPAERSALDPLELVDAFRAAVGRTQGPIPAMDDKGAGAAA